MNERVTDKVDEVDEILDEQLLAELRELAAKVDPVPQEIIEAAKKNFANREISEQDSDRSL